MVDSLLKIVCGLSKSPVARIAVHNPFLVMRCSKPALIQKRSFRKLFAKNVNQKIQIRSMCLHQSMISQKAFECIQNTR